jgi:hypothetical protein
MRAPARITVAALCALAALATPARADVTTSDITIPAHGTRVVFDNSEPTITVSGTSDGKGGDSVDIVCFERTGQAPLFETVPVAADGSFTATAKPDNLVGACRLRALPHDPPAGLVVTPFAGPGVVVEHRTTDRIMSGPNTDRPFDYFVLNQQDRGVADYDSVGECGLCDMRLTDFSRWTNSQRLFIGAAALYRYNAPDGRNSVNVGGRPAYAPAAARVVNPDAPGLPALEHTVSVDPVTHDLRIDESEALVHCPGDPVPATATNCTAFQAAAVRLERTILQSEAGVLVRITDRWVNTSGSAQRVDLRYDQLLRDPGDGRHPSYDLSWEPAGYAVRAGGQSVAGPGWGPGTIFVRAASDAPDGGFDLPQGAITAFPPPSAIRFLAPTDFIADYSMSLPPGGSETVVHVFRMATNRAELNAGARRAEDELGGPSVSFSTPAGGATVRPAVTVTGAASDNGGLDALQVAGRPVAPGPGGRWSVRLRLREGPATIEAVARDHFGNSATANRRLLVDGTPPSVRRLRLSARRFAVGRRATPRSAAQRGTHAGAAVRRGTVAGAAPRRGARARRAPRRGTVFRYRLSEPAVVSLAIEHPARGVRLAGRGCVSATARNRRALARRLAKRVRRMPRDRRARALRRLRRAARCTVYVRDGALRRAVPKSGGVSTPFTGRIGRGPIRPGPHRVTVRATDAAGNRSRPVRATFTVVRRRVH